MPAYNSPLRLDKMQTVKEVAASLEPVFAKKPELLPVFAQLCEPERQIVFRVPWLDDSNKMQASRSCRWKLMQVDAGGADEQ